MIAVVHLGLDGGHLLGGILIDVLARFGGGGDAIGRLGGSVAALGIVSARTLYTSSPVSWPRLIVVPMPY
jgi:hypothetical protein